MPVVFKKAPWDTLMLLLILALVGLGLVMLLSASSILAERKMGDPYYYFKPQLIYAAMGLSLMWVLQKVPYQIWPRISYPILVVVVIALIVVLIPGVGYKVGGARRWLRIMGYSIQPAELAKLAIIFYMAYSLTNKEEMVKTFAHGILPHLIVLGFLIPLILAQPDFGTALVIVALAGVMMFVAGAPLRYLLGLILLAVPLLWYLIVSEPYRMKRIAGYLNPWDDPQDTGYHIIHSIYALASGGIFGVGPGASQQKLGFLPETHTDFIFSIVGEELGFLGVVVVALLFLALIIRGLMVAASARDRLGVYMAVGLTMLVGVPAFLNMGVVLNLLPTKGMPLPFFSYGGTNLLVCFAAMGIVLNIAGQARESAASARNPAAAAPARPAWGRA